MKKLLLVLALSPICSAQDTAKLTIYTPGGWMKGAGRAGATMGIGEHEVLSQGQLFDADKKLGSMFPGRFVTFELTPGSHSIGTEMPGKEKRREVIIDAKPGEQYFLRLTATSKGVWAIQFYTSHLELVPCDAARKEADSTKPLQVKFVEKSARNQLVDGTYFPRCK